MSTLYWKDKDRTFFINRGKPRRKIDRKHIQYKETCNVYKVKTTINRMPMKYFTPKEVRPSEKTLKMIRQIAYTYRAIKMNGKNEAFCLN